MTASEKNLKHPYKIQIMPQHLRWRHVSGDMTPVARFPGLISRYGPPDVVDKGPGGVAIWKKETLMKKGVIWNRIELRDELVPHNDPAPHQDFLYAWYKVPAQYIPVPPSTVCQLLKLSESLTYDPLKHLIRARCHFMGANIVTIWLAMEIIQGRLSLAQARALYGPTIMRTLPSSDTYDAMLAPRLVASLAAA